MKMQSRRRGRGVKVLIGNMLTISLITLLRSVTLYKVHIQNRNVVINYNTSIELI